MEANELRIGNLVKYSLSNIPQEIKSVINVHGEYIVNFQNCEFSNTIDKIKPIPLTEEWLLRFGFNKLEFINNRFQKEYGDFYFELVETNKDNCFHLKIRNGNFGTNFVGLGIFKYVHQLQNLFFCLCGQELTIK